ncbi:carboxymuconolactone decarboxylase family protein [Zunongwangia sp. F260]|uniref:Carboxymuconolactone decarboxylase family protein n=1 Tax=Autumnicola lenta TaxID=3075593 RepID=A0ABU3CN50_9FLAO|nr:carboxymuconolactone decarboxylase family protein [Zunongwangia sp. F260]MDT0647623.1 carboxymuconolactone decarboxylase family protein [Zunongwangia sp. F260]
MKLRNIGLIITLLIMANLYVSAQTASQGLSAEEYSIARISAATAKGDLKTLQEALNEGLDSGLSVNKVKEELVHLYAYCGFPRSLMAINTLTEVLENREERGIEDKTGEEPTDLKDGDKYKIGKEVLADLTGVEDRPKAGYAKTVPIIEVFLKEHLFADIFKRGVLSFKEREIATVTALLTMGDLAPMVKGHMKISMRLGVTEPQILQILKIIETDIDKRTALKGRKLFAEITSDDPIDPDQYSEYMDIEKIYPRGEKIINPVFTGTAWLEMLVTADEVNRNSVGVVTFEPKARTYWHQHPNGQIILALSGEGYYQEKGSPKKILKKGDIIKCPANTPHWHGAGPEEEFVQIAITSRINGPTEWFETVSDKKYRN